MSQHKHTHTTIPAIHLSGLTLFRLAEAHHHQMKPVSFTTNTKNTAVNAEYVIKLQHNPSPKRQQNLHYSDYLVSCVTPPSKAAHQVYAELSDLNHFLSQTSYCSSTKLFFLSACKLQNIHYLLWPVMYGRCPSNSFSSSSRNSDRLGLGRLGRHTRILDTDVRLTGPLREKANPGGCEMRS